MSSTDDLLTRLRDSRYVGQEGMREEAAVEIERLRRENDRLHNQNRLLQQRDDYVTGCLV